VIDGSPHRVAVLGAGTMGVGIALCFARAGIDVVLTSRRATTLETSRARIEQRLAELARAGALNPAAIPEIVGRVQTTPGLEQAVSGAEVVVESVVEDLDVKHQVLARAERAAPVGALIATDTSSISIDELAAALKRPESFAGMHWFNPPEQVALVEVVSGARTTPEVAQRLVDLARALGKRPVHVRRDIAGFVANRIQYAVFREAFALVQSGVCSYADLDEAVRPGPGARWAAVGPFESLDLAGLDVHQAVATRLYPTLAVDTEPARVVTDLVAAGNLGCKTGRGLYGDYDGEAIAALTERRARMLLALERLTQKPEAGPSAPHDAS
jgi:3-hydroxybutyryl-CoA dehydrogenase